jgi:AraC-like DNA-binding protein
MLWPFLRVLPDFAAEMRLLAAARIDPGSIADAEARIPRRLLGEMVFSAIGRTGDGALGLHAGERIESSDFGVMDRAVHACANVRAALACVARYMRLMDDGAEARLVEKGGQAIWQIRNVTPPVFHATNDFQVAVSLTNLRRLGMCEAPREIHVHHPQAAYAEEYARVFECPVRFGMEHNGLVFSRSVLDQPVPTANPEAFSIFDVTAARRVAQLDRTEKMSQRVRKLLLYRLGRESVSIIGISALLHVSQATLRRRLEEEGTTYKAMLDEQRRRLAELYIAESHVSMNEISSLLGFSTQSAFGRAFRRWNRSSPLRQRRHLRGLR